MAVIVNGDGILTGISSLATALTDLTSGRGTVTGVATVGTLQLGAGVSISSPRSQQAAIFTNNTEFLTVDDAGRVGVGTVTPNSDAHPQNVGKINVGFITARSIAGDIDANTMVVAGVSTFVGAINANGGVTGNLTGNVTGTASGNAVLTGSTDNQLVTVTGANAITGESNLIFDGTDTLEMGTAAGGAGYDSNMKLRIGRGSDCQICVRNTGGDTNYGGLIFGDQSSSFGGGIQYHHNGNSLRFYTNGNNEKLRIASDGSVGIGEVSPANLLHVKVSDTGVAPHASAQIVLERSGTNYLQFLTAADGTSGLLFGDANDNDVGKIVYDHNVTELQFNTETAQRMKITGGGIVQIGGNTANSADLDASNTKLTIKQSANSQEDGIYIERSGERRGFYIYMGGALSTSDSLSITTNQLGGDTDVMAIDRGGDIVVANNIKMNTSGKGIDFSTGASGNSTSNLLDEYEEGTFSGTASAAGYSGGSAIALLDETYTKIGRMVHFNCRLQVASNLNDGDLQLSGLPFSAAQDSVVDFSWQDAAGFNGGQGKISGTTCVRFNGNFPTHSSGTANIIFSGTYRTAS